MKVFRLIPKNGKGRVWYAHEIFSRDGFVKVFSKDGFETIVRIDGYKVEIDSVERRAGQ